MSNAATMPATAATSPADWLKKYLPAAGRHDELKDARGAIRPVWRKLAETLAAASAEELAQDSEQVHRLIQENGITYNVYGEAGNTTRPWGMDVVPMLLEHAEWEKIETALSQRARLFNLILRDLYGAQTLLEQRIIPPALVLGNPAFLRPCHGYTPPNGMFVPIYGADLGRAPTGQWWVLAERLDAPSGTGYSLENRALTARVLPNWLRDNSVARLAPFIQTLRDCLAGLAPQRPDPPRMALLTPGPANETYFEHSYLARNLGFPLVEGGDLLVRGQRVCLKTLMGLRPVDLILRRVDSDYCDSLELRRDSLLGVPGLLQAVRAGNLAMANALGAGLLEAPGISPFLPALCRHLLGEELKMPSVATWWCGQPRELDYVLEHLESLILLPALSTSTREAVVGPRLDQAQREQWRDRLRAEPEAWCAREWVALATTPVYEHGKLTPRIFQLRTLVAARGEDYHALPGGLTRIPAEDDDLTVSMQRGGRSKDTWVLLPPGRPPVAEVAAPAPPVVKLRRPAPDLPSRVADNLYWMGRYVERTDGQTRVLRLLAGALAGEGAAADPDLLRPFFETLLLQDASYLLAPGQQPALDLAAAERSLRAMLWDTAQPNSLANNIARIEHMAYRVKEYLPADMWSLLGRLGRKRRTPAETAAFLRVAFAELRDAIVQLAAINGFMTENMIHGYGWRFLDLGRRLERGLNMADMLGRVLSRPGVPSAALLNELLVSSECLPMYRRRYLANLNLVAVLDMLACDDSNPRGLAYQLQCVRQHVEEFPREPGSDPASRPVERLAHALTAQAELLDAHHLAQTNEAGARPALREFLHTVIRDLSALSDALGQAYFAHSQPEAKS